MESHDHPPCHRARIGMNPHATEQELSCPYCGESISVVLDLSVDGVQDYVEDCEVCCRPIRFTVCAEDGMLVQFDNGQSD